MTATEPLGAEAAGTPRASPVPIAYLVSRFPLPTETFVARELTRVASDPRLDVRLFSLFPGSKDAPPEDAKPWVQKLEPGSVRGAMSGLAYWMRSSPGTLITAFAKVIRDYGRRPSVLARALVAAAEAAGHARVVERDGIRHVHAHFATYPALAAWLVGELTGASFSFTAHAHDLYVHQLGIARRARAAKFVVPISQFNRGFIAGIAGTDVTQHVIRCGIDLTKYRPRSSRLAGERSRVVMISSFRAYKGHWVLVDALASDPALNGVTAVLIGDGPLRPEIEAYAAARGVRSQLDFRGWVPEAEVRGLLADADVLVQPSVVEPSGDTEGIPNTLIEAMALEVPVVGTDVTGISELIEDGRDGLLVPAGDVGALAAALRATLEDPAGSRERAIAGRQKVARLHDGVAEAAALADLLAAAAGAEG